MSQFVFYSVDVFFCYKCLNNKCLRCLKTSDFSLELNFKDIHKDKLNQMFAEEGEVKEGEVKEGELRKELEEEEEDFFSDIFLLEL